VILARRSRYRLEELAAAMRPEDEPETIDDLEAPPLGNELL